MILIISNTIEQSTSEVSEWLLYKKAKHIIITENNAIKDVCFILKNTYISQIKLKTINEQEIDFEYIDAVWYRRDGLRFNLYTKIENKIVSENINDEWIALKEFILQNFKTKKVLGRYSEKEINKLFVLKNAIMFGLEIPDTIVCTNDAFVKTNYAFNRIISKHISNIINFNIKDRNYSIKTIEINKEKLPLVFFPSLFQNLIEKKYELRIFFINNKFYSMAIFSQEDDKTKIDFRNYNYIKPNRTVPFILPQHVKIKLKKLMESLNLNTGSIDMIVTPDDKFVFLEVNPYGQFGMVSYPCNYFIEKEIANFLIKKQYE